MTSAVVEPVFPNPSITDLVDGAMMYATTNYQPVKDAGYGGMSAYIGGNFAITRRNIEAWWALGGWWSLNFERAANAYTGGASLGRIHANTALQQAASLGWLKESPIIFSATDTNVSSGDVSTAHDYYHAMVDVFQAAGADGGAYGPPAYLRQLAAQSWWPNWPLWQWAGAGNVESWTWVKQVFTPTHAGISSIPFTIDENHLYRPLRVWTGYGPDDPPPDPLGDPDMLINPFVQVQGDPAIWYSPDGITRRHIVDFTDLRSTMYQSRYITLNEANTLTDDQLRAKVTQLGNASELDFWGVDVGASSPTVITDADKDDIAARSREKLRTDPLT